MALGNWPVASLRKRAVYKTEFDIFKQNTDIELISLVSYDEHESDLRQIASKAQHREQEEFNKHRKNFEQINRNKVRIAYDPNSKYNRTSARQEREFKPNIWNKGDSSIYKAFARNSKTFLKNRTYGRNTNRSRTCYSAIEVRKPTNETVRSQSTCGVRTNERNWIKGGKINKSNVSNIETKENAVNRNLNKQGVSTNKTSWRAKSAPTAPPHNLHNSRIQNKSGYSTREKSAKLSTRAESNNQECKQKVEKCGTELFIDEDEIKQAVRIQGPPREQIVSFVEEECLDNGIDNISVDNTVSEECSRNNQFGERQVKECENDYDKQSGNADVKSDITEKNNTIYYAEDHSKSAHLVNVVDDPLESKDSGFASDTVTPELELKRVVNECEEPTSRKHVKFVFDVNESCENSSLVDGCSAVSENGLSDKISVSSIDSGTVNEETTTYDVNTLISDLERLGANSRLSVVSAGCQSIYSHDGGNDSLCGENVSKVSPDVNITKEEIEAKENEEIQRPADDLENLNMSKEARHAILETLQDMGVKPDKRNSREIDLRDIKHKSVNVQRKQKDNRSKYEFYMRERTKSFYKQQFRSMDSVGNEDNSSRYSSPTNARECDDSTSDELHKGKLFPTIKEMKKPSFGPKPTTQTKQIVTLENVRHKKHKIPGIGNYHMIASPDSDFEITPPGFDVRYNRPIISNEEMEIPPRFIRERSIQKCKNWLKRNINLSPLSLQPAKKS